ncbi:L-ascorbate oxidase [Aspergillus vadensis CBS 113365]|uniref:L-ascorbate oxidase n=1 Tax=Aspergillus vadensis (strain CBS 113365 / IMI 142717 / IBT 24658) TaxID=1448311 RepID=A0A319B777_ASPVC|nr:L-ascorbate oxidase [Aspergillus vadensis CBS 113365]PYH68666.1 L-ascorbate oxidase [Aspergillus vadensis CBS 113365]
MKWSQLNTLVLPVLSCLIQLSSSRVVDFRLDLTWEDSNVAGISRKAIHTNGQVPAPNIRVNQGDQVRVLVNNSMPFGTTVHWHGIPQYGTPWSDGVPGLNQEMIKPGEQFYYEWTATDYGSYAYHAHTRAQMDDGLYGAIYVEPRADVQRPFSKISSIPYELQAMLQAEKNTHPIMLSDWRVFTSEETLQIEEDSGVQATCTNAILVNGKGSVICPPQDHINDLTRSGEWTALSSAGNKTMSDMGCMPPLKARLGGFSFDESKIPPGYYQGCVPTVGEQEVLSVDARSRYVSYDLISLPGTSNLVFSIDEHPMYLYAVDGRYVDPVVVDAINVYAGSRYSVLVKLDQPISIYTVRVANKFANQIINGTALMSYTGSEPSQFNTSTRYINEVGTAAGINGTIILDEAQIVPFEQEAPAPEPDQTQILQVNLYNASYRWTLGQASYPMANEDLTPPALFNYSSIPAEYTVMTKNNTWVDIIFNMTSIGQPQHPIHKHSNKFFVLGWGSGVWKWSTVAEAMEEIPDSLNLVNPQLRDTFQTPASTPDHSWLAIRYHVVNPGPFFMHCHLSMHESGGLAVALLDGVDAWPTVPDRYQLPALSDPAENTPATHGLMDHPGFD